MIKEIKELRIPPYEEFSVWKKYGISQKCCIYRNNITKDPYFIACIFNQVQTFENSEKGLQEAIVWFEEQRANALLALGYKEVED